jgi:hyperosmotically inducible protein
MRRIYQSLLIIGLANVITGCLPAVAVGGAGGGYYLAKDKGSAGQYTDDSVITSKIKSKFLADSEIKSFNVSVNTTNKVVTLAGKVPTLAMKQRAIAIAAQTKEVRQVDAHTLQVKK